MAGRIPQHFIDELLARTDLAEVIGSRLTLKKTGKNFSGLCPFHNEKSPSFSVNPDKQFYYCFGCGASGNALTFLMEHDHQEFVEAVETLARMQGMQVPREEGGHSGRSEQQRQQQKVEADLRQHCMELASRFYQDYMQQPGGQAGLNYFRQLRGLSDATLESFALGVAPDAWDALKNHLLQAGVSEALQLELGLLVQKEETGRVYDRFRNRVVFPIRNIKGQTIGFGGRVLDDSKPKYLNSPETPLFHKGQELYGLYEARRQPGRLDRILVVEGYMDVVALAQQGIHWAVATLGTATSEEHLRRIFRLVNEVVFCFDGDAAGSQAAVRALQTVLPLMTDGRHARFLFLPQGEDPDTLVRKEGAGLFEQRVGQALPLAEYLLRYLQQGLDLDLLDDQARMATAARPLLQALPVGLLKRRIITQVCRLSGLTENDLLGSPGGQAQGRVAEQSVPAAGASATFRQVAAPEVNRSAATAGMTLPPQERLLRLLVRYPRLIAQVPEKLAGLLEEESLLARLLDYLLRSPDITPQVLLAYWAGTPEGEALAERAQQALELNQDAAATEVCALARHLLEQQEASVVEARYQALLEASRQGQLSPQEHQELWQLVQSKHHKSNGK
ncbi:DNA primase [Marinospirillum alkaliphilum]|uniref:DNA primase n=1 Tax=Marinospirillum alkaliphilum DSM 21637 TaxID=1122209 RepID=A0A1K1VHS2_9GAMM|nr:DNA primase [Marinospirillum alkaliphilum]SFX24720.1 DNA primase [Marinospirillum alkaliphilum DSM 21637]